MPPLATRPVSLRPTLEVRNLETSLRWYRTMGFVTEMEMPGPNGDPVFAHLRWGDDVDLVLVSDRPDAQHRGLRGTGVTLTFTLQSGSVDELAERAREMGAKILAGPSSQPWQTREVMLADPDGYRLTFAKPLPPRPAKNHRRRRISRA